MVEIQEIFNLCMNITVEETVVITKIVINIVAFLVCLVAFIGVSYGGSLSIINCNFYNIKFFPSQTKKG